MSIVWFRNSWRRKLALAHSCMAPVCTGSFRVVVFILWAGVASRCCLCPAALWRWATSPGSILELLFNPVQELIHILITASGRLPGLLYRLVEVGHSPFFDCQERPVHSIQRVLGRCSARHGSRGAWVFCPAFEDCSAVSE